MLKVYCFYLIFLLFFIVNIIHQKFNPDYNDHTHNYSIMQGLKLGLSNIGSYSFLFRVSFL